MQPEKTNEDVGCWMLEHTYIRSGLCRVNVERTPPQTSMCASTSHTAKQQRMVAGKGHWGRKLRRYRIYKSTPEYVILLTKRTASDTSDASALVSLPASKAACAAAAPFPAKACTSDRVCTASVCASASADRTSIGDACVCVHELNQQIERRGRSHDKGRRSEGMGQRSALGTSKTNVEM